MVNKVNQCIRFDPLDKAQGEAIAVEHRINFSEWVRRLVQQAIARHKKK